MKILKFARFPAIEFQYSDAHLKYLNATSIWIVGLIFQIITTLTSAYSTFSVLFNRCFIRKIKVFIRKKYKYQHVQIKKTLSGDFISYERILLYHKMIIRFMIKNLILILKRFPRCEILYLP